jgi:hypothetical protein
LGIPAQASGKNLTRPLMPSKVLEIYALRWAVEVYFKEAKQPLKILET